MRKTIYLGLLATSLATMIMTTLTSNVLAEVDFGTPDDATFGQEQSINKSSKISLSSVYDPDDTIKESFQKELDEMVGSIDNED